MYEYSLKVELINTTMINKWILKLKPLSSNKLTSKKLD